MLSTGTFWVVLLRGLQTLLEAAPTLLCGVLLAAVLRGMIGPATIRGWFGRDPREGPVRAYLFGLLTPVCSLGVLPVAWELRRAAVPRATVLTFLLAAPLANPISLAYGFQKLESQGQAGLGTLVFLLVGGFVVLAGMGVLLGRWLPEPAEHGPSAPEPPRTDVRRIALAGLTAVRALTGPLLFFLVLGLLGSGLLALAPGGALQNAINDRTVYASSHMAAVAIPLQTPPDLGIMMVSEMLFARVSFGVAFAFFLLGVGMNVGTLAWIVWAFGPRVLLRSAPVAILGAILVGLAVPFALPNLAPGSERSRRFFEIETDLGPETAWSRVVSHTLTTDTGQPHWYLILATAALAVLAVAGLFCRRLWPNAAQTLLADEPPPTPNASPGPTSVLNRPLTAPQLALATLAMFLILAVAGLYVFYPAPPVLFDEMANVQLELSQALKSQPVNRNDIRRYADQIERLEKKIALGELLRRGRHEPRLKQAADELRAALRQLRAGLDDDRPAAELEPLANALRQATRRCREAASPPATE